MKKETQMFVVLIFTIISFSSCNGNNNDSIFLGTWKTVEGSGYNCMITIEKNGASFLIKLTNGHCNERLNGIYTLTDEGNLSGNNVTIAYIVDKKQLLTSFGHGSLSWVKVENAIGKTNSKMPTEDSNSGSIYLGTWKTVESSGYDCMITIEKNGNSFISKLINGRCNERLNGIYKITKEGNLVSTSGNTFATVTYSYIFDAKRLLTNFGQGSLSWIKVGE